MAILTDFCLFKTLLNKINVDIELIKTKYQNYCLAFVIYTCIGNFKYQFKFTWNQIILDTDLEVSTVTVKSCSHEDTT